MSDTRSRGALLAPKSSVLRLSSEWANRLKHLRIGGAVLWEREEELGKAEDGDINPGTHNLWVLHTAQMEAYAETIPNCTVWFC